MAEPIRTGNSVTYTSLIQQDSGDPFPLASCSLSSVVSTQQGTAALTHSLVLDAGGGIISQDGLTLTGDAADGIVADTITGLETTALGVGWYVWRLYLTDTDGNTWKVDEQTFELRDLSLVVQWGGTTLWELIRDTADHLGDLRILDASDVGDSSHFVDDLNINGAAMSLNGRMMYVATGANAGHLARITATDGSSNRITFTPAAPGAFAIGDEVHLTNEHSRGWERQHYRRAINRAIQDAYPLARVTISATIATAFDVDTATITLPTEFTHIYEVGFEDPLRGGYIPLRKGQWYGWITQPTGQMTLRDAPAHLANGRTLRIVGYGRYPELHSDTDRTTLRREYIIKTAVARLLESGIGREDARASLILKAAQEAERERTKIRIQPHADIVKVRV